MFNQTFNVYQNQVINRKVSSKVFSFLEHQSPQLIFKIQILGIQNPHLGSSKVISRSPKLSEIIGASFQLKSNWFQAWCSQLLNPWSNRCFTTHACYRYHNKMIIQEYDIIIRFRIKPRFYHEIFLNKKVHIINHEFKVVYKAPNFGSCCCWLFYV